MMVLDASALLALVRREPGAAVVEAHLVTGHVSAVNASEFVQKVDQHGGNGEEAFRILEGLGVRLQPVVRADALLAAAIYEATKPYGLSIADRLCLALAKRLAAPACTADAAWTLAADRLGIELQLIR